MIQWFWNKQIKQTVNYYEHCLVEIYLQRESAIEWWVWNTHTQTEKTFLLDFVILSLAIRPQIKWRHYWHLDVSPDWIPILGVIKLVSFNIAVLSATYITHCFHLRKPDTFARTIVTANLLYFIFLLTQPQGFSSYIVIN